jgi:hypothetical protein
MSIVGMVLLLVMLGEVKFSGDIISLRVAINMVAHTILGVVILLGYLYL